MRRGAAIAIAGVLALGVAACGGDDDDENGGATTAPAEETETVTTPAEQEGTEVPLEALNDSGVEGTARIERRDGELAVSLEASNTTPNEQHLAHLHIPEQGEGACPTVEEHDEDGDGRLSLEEGVPAYGPVAVEFMPFPEADAEGNVTFDQTLTTDGEPDVERGVVVVHGGEVDGEYQAPLPVACGAVE